MKNPRSFQLSKLKRARVFSFAEMVASWRGGASMPSASTPPRHAANPLRFAARLQASVTGSAGERISPSPLHEKPAVVPTFQVETSAGFSHSRRVLRRGAEEPVCQASPRRRATPRIRFALLRVFKLRSPAFAGERISPSPRHEKPAVVPTFQVETSAGFLIRANGCVVLASCLRPACVLIAS